MAGGDHVADDYEFTTDWFVVNEPVWRNMIAEIKPRKALEIGTFEGRAAAFMIERCSAFGPFEITCVDTWAGGAEHSKLDMSAVEARFDRNMGVAKARCPDTTVRKIKSASVPAMARLLADGAANAFDVVYVDASHEAPDVLADAVLAFQLTRVGGILIFDDYLWQNEESGREDLFNMPKLGIDSFVNTFYRKLTIVAGAPLRQLYMQKFSD